MENLDDLFRKAERLKPTEAMWKRIEAGARERLEAGLASGASGPDGSSAGNGLAVGEAAAGAVAAGGSAYGGERHWRLAASVAIALGALAALFLVLRDPTGVGSAGSAGVASREGGNGSASPLVQEEDPVLDEDILAWHADLGEASAMDWEYDDAFMVPDALMEPAEE